LSKPTFAVLDFFSEKNIQFYKKFHATLDFRETKYFSLVLTSWPQIFVLGIALQIPKSLEEKKFPISFHFQILNKKKFSPAKPQVIGDFEISSDFC